MVIGEFQKLAKAIQAYYPKQEYFKDNESLMLWYEELKDIDYTVATIALRKHIRTSKFPVTIADIIGNAVDVQSSDNTWSDGWEIVLKAVRMYGYAQEKAALESMDEITRTAVKRLGWQTLCKSEINELTAIRANFRMIYTEIKDKEIADAKLSVELKKAIDHMKQNTKMLE